MVINTEIGGDNRKHISLRTVSLTAFYFRNNLNIIVAMVIITFSNKVSSPITWNKVVDVICVLKYVRSVTHFVM